MFHDFAEEWIITFYYINTCLCSLPENTGQDDTPECVKVKKTVDMGDMTHFVTKL